MVYEEKHMNSLKVISVTANNLLLLRNANPNHNLYLVEYPKAMYWVSCSFSYSLMIYLIVRNFADYTNILFHSKSIDELITMGRNTLNELNTWLGANKFTLNIEKSSFIIFKSEKKKFSIYQNTLSF